MRKYWILIKNSFQEHIEYRLNLGFEVIGSVLLTLVIIWLWQAVLASRGGSVGTYTHAQLLTYLIGSGIITSYFFITSQGDAINDDINRGDLSNILVKPINPILHWFLRDVTRKLVTLGIGLFAFIAVIVAYRIWVLPPADVTALLWFLVFTLTAGVLHFFLFGLFALLAFWSEQTWGERFVLRIFMELASGILIPLTLFPQYLQTLVRYLPFRFFAFVPMEIYLGRMTTHVLMREGALLLAWCVVLIIASLIVFRRGLRVYTGEGI